MHYRFSLILTGIIMYFFPGNQILIAQNSDQKIEIRHRIMNQENPEFKELDLEISRLMKSWSITGAAVSILQEGKLVYTRGYGYADKQNKIEMQPENRFRIASVSKLITAVAIMKMREMGLIDLDQKVFGKHGILNDPIYYGKVSDRRIYNISVRHLLNHSAGWSRRTKGDPLFMKSYIARSLKLNNDSLQNSDVIRYMLSQSLDFTPGTQSQYSNLGYSILGEIIEKISGLTYADYVQEHLFTPIGIQNIAMGSNDYNGRLPEEVHYYDLPRMNKMMISRGFSPRPYGSTDVEMLGAAGGWVASPVEISMFLASIDGNGEDDILTPESLDIMARRTDKLLPFGWIGVNSNNDWWRTGTLAGTSALMVRKSNGLSFVFITNTSTEAGNDFPSIAYASIEKGISAVKEWTTNDLFRIMNRQLVKLDIRSSDFLTLYQYQVPSYQALQPVHMLNLDEPTLAENGTR
jgi:CubicO group peptidase (beta-lactamase class C family)